MIKCLRCKKEVERRGNNQKFCSRDCACKYWRENNPEKQKKLTETWQRKNQERMRKVEKRWRKDNPEKEKEKVKRYRKKYPEKAKAHNYANNVLRKKILEERKVCEKCGSNKNLELHHKRYENNKKAILLLCKKCHLKIHRGELKS